MKYALLGLVYALFCLALAISAAGAGHGIIAPLATLCPSLWLVENDAAYIWPVLLWPIAFYLAERISPGKAVAFVVLLELLSIGSLFISIPEEKFSVFTTLWPFVVGFYLLFLAGQIVLWRGLRRRFA